MAWLKWMFQHGGYVVRPYDMLADRRRWFWQPRQRCGWPTTRGPNYRECPRCPDGAAMSQPALDEHIRQAHPGTARSLTSGGDDRG
jgi:hypothetical protein